MEKILGKSQTFLKRIEKISKEIEGIRSSTVRWVAGLMLANTALMISMLKFL